MSKALNGFYIPDSDSNSEKTATCATAVNGATVAAMRRRDIPNTSTRTAA